MYNSVGWNVFMIKREFEQIPEFLNARPSVPVRKPQRREVPLIPELPLPIKKPSPSLPDKKPEPVPAVIK